MLVHSPRISHAHECARGNVFPPLAESDFGLRKSPDEEQF
jgi:hypothetical protein